MKTKFNPVISNEDFIAKFLNKKLSLFLTNGSEYTGKFVSIVTSEKFEKSTSGNIKSEWVKGPVTLKFQLDNQLLVDLNIGSIKSYSFL